MNSLNSTKIKNAKDSGIDKNSMSDIKSNKQIESELSSSTISKHSGVNNMIIEKNETREINEAGIYMDNSLASKLSVSNIH